MTVIVYVRNVKYKRYALMISLQRDKHLKRTINSLYTVQTITHGGRLTRNSVLHTVTYVFHG